MRYIKHFDAYMYGEDLLSINNIMNYLGVYDIDDEESKIESVYDVDVIGFLKEIFMNKIIIFTSQNALEGDPTIKGKVKEVKIFPYKDEFFVEVKLLNPEIKRIDHFEKIGNKYKSYLMKNNHIIAMYEYDADTKPLHKEVKMKKLAEKYNL